MTGSLEARAICPGGVWVDPGLLDNIFSRSWFARGTKRRTATQQNKESRMFLTVVPLSNSKETLATASVLKSNSADKISNSYVLLHEAVLLETMFGQDIS